MAEVVIGYRLDLAVKLLDTTTGSPVSDEQALFFVDGQRAAFSQRMEGVYIRFGEGSEEKTKQDIELGVHIKGYRTAKKTVGCDILSKQYPTVEIPLIPEHQTNGYSNVAALEGRMDGIEDIEAVSLHAPLAQIASYHHRKQTMKLLYAGNFTEERYALISEGGNAYEAFRIRGRRTGLSLKLDSPLETDCHAKDCIARIVRGCVDENGSYLLCVRQDAFGTAYLVRYSVNGKVQFRQVVFDKPGERRLEAWA